MGRVVKKGLLRIALLYGGQVYRERVMRQAADVTVGESHDHALTVPVPGADLELQLFRHDASRGVYHLVLHDFFSGRLRLGGEELTAAEARAKAVQLEVRPGDWGLLSLTDDQQVQIFFQLVDMEVGGIKGKRRADWPVLQSFLFALVVHAGILVLAFMAMHEGGDLESVRIPRRFAKLMARRPPRQTQVKKPDDAKTKKQSLKSRRQAVMDRHLVRPDLYHGPRPRFMNRRLNKGAVWAIGAARRRSAAVRKLLDSGSIDTDLENTLGQLTGRGGDAGGDPGGVLSFDGTRGGGSRDGGYGATDYGGALGTGGPIRHRGRLRNRGFTRKIPKGRITLGSYKISGGLTRAQIQRVVRSRRGALKFCYERALRLRPELGSGRVTVKFKISPAGMVISARAISNTLKGGSAVAACITRTIRRWRFPASTLYSHVTYPFFFSSGLK